ncbi:MAG: PTS sugar transporter subunit IIA, partial [Methylobacteriaceae bacterium]|nr:PTS sugar transporter subunit IIA [Methylobacteriaceae bacterium]
PGGGVGSRGRGGGTPTPHGKLARCNRIFGVFARLEKPIDFEALDDAPVDLIFLLIAPENAGADHLNALSRAARMLRDQSLVATLRSTRDPSALYSILVRSPTPNAA